MPKLIKKKKSSAFGFLVFQTESDSLKYEGMEERREERKQKWAKKKKP